MADWMRAEIERELVVERDGWAVDRVRRVTERLLGDSEKRFETLVVWLADHGAYTAPGLTIYVSRRLLERLADDDAAAFVIAHELAHHRLGHVPDVPTALRHLPVTVVIAVLRRWIASRRRERDADLSAIEMCVAAGYDAERCIAALEYLEQVSLDYGDVDGVLGSEDGRERGSHPAVRTRVAAVRAHVAAMARGHRLAHELAADRERRRRRIVAATALVAGAGALVLALWRRRPV